MKRMFDYKELNDKLNRAIPINGNGDGYVEDYINPTDYPNGTTIKLTDFLWTVPNGDDIHINGLLEIKRWDYFHCIEELTIIDDSGSIYEKWGRTIYDNNESGWNRLDNNINFDYPYATGTFDRPTKELRVNRTLEKGLYYFIIEDQEYSISATFNLFISDLEFVTNPTSSFISLYDYDSDAKVIVYFSYNPGSNQGYFLNTQNQSLNVYCGEIVKIFKLA